MDLSHYQLPQKLKPRFRSERDELIQSFLGHEIQVQDRKTKSLKLATAAEIALLLKDTPTSDLYAFHRMCQGARSFSRFFWWRLKGNTTNPVQKRMEHHI